MLEDRLLQQVVNYNVGSCPVCHQGILQIVKDGKLEKLYIYCDECEAEWDNPKDAISGVNGSRGKYGKLSLPEYDEIVQLGWNKYISVKDGNYD